MSDLRIHRFIIAVILGVGAAYLATSFFSYFYPTRLNFIFLALALNILAITLAYGALDELAARLQRGLRTEWPGLLVYLLASSLTLSGFLVSSRYPELFDARLLSMESADLPLFLGLTLLSIPFAVLLVRRARGQLPPAFIEFLRFYLPGLLLASIFFLAYFIFAETINFPARRTLDQYFDLDISAWLARLTAASPADITDVVRAVHPAILLFLRPLVGLISFFLNGDRLHATFIVHALAAASCVFLTWRIVKRMTGRTTYALIFATLLGASASHLLLGSMLETYIYSALALLIFVTILQKEKLSLPSTIPAGVLIFGITVTNLAQAVALYYVKRPRLKIISIFLLLVVGFGLILNALQVWIYPAANFLWPSNIRGEQAYQFNLFESDWRMMGRVRLVTRAVALYDIVAPTPFILTEELGATYPNFRTFEITIGEFHVAGYDGLADLTVKFWTGILLAGFLLFAWDWYKKNRSGLAFSLLMCLGFNLFLHILYGDDPMLYSPDWVYALALFLAIAFQRFAGNKWFQLAAVGFLALVMTVNVGLLRQIMEVSLPFYGK
ncbi:MAG: hypothetical protein AB1750_05890 [Chloroflexota bacterium]